MTWSEKVCWPLTAAASVDAALLRSAEEEAVADVDWVCTAAMVRLVVVLQISGRSESVVSPVRLALATDWAS